MAEEVERVRPHLLKFYSDECRAHATNVLSIALIFFTYLQALHSKLPIIVNSGFLSVFVTIGIYQVARLLWWALLTTRAMRVRAPNPLPNEMQDPLISQLDSTCQRAILNRPTYDNLKDQLRDEIIATPLARLISNRWVLLIVVGPGLWLVFYLIQVMVHVN